MAVLTVVILQALLCAAQTLASPTRYTLNDFEQMQIDASPLLINVQNAELPGAVVASVTNRGLDTAYFSTWRNILSDDDFTRKVELSDIKGASVQYLKAEGYPMHESAPIEDVIKLESGASVTKLIDLVDNYDIMPNSTYIVHAQGSIPYRLQRNASWSSTAAYKSVLLMFTADESNSWHRLDEPVVSSHDRHVFKGCDDAQFSAQVKRAVESTAGMTKAVADRIKEGKGKDAFMAYFKSNDDETRKQVADRYTAMYNTLTGKDAKSIISCRASCSGYLAMGAAWTGPADGSTFFCPAMKTTPEKASKCVRMVWPGVIMHELSHNAKLFKPGTADTAQGAVASKRLTTAKALRNADTFNMFGQSMYLNTVC